MTRLADAWKRINQIYNPPDDGSAKSRAQLAAKAEISRFASPSIRFKGWLLCGIPVAWIFDRVTVHLGFGSNPALDFGVAVVGGIIVGETIRAVYIHHRKN